MQDAADGAGAKADVVLVRGRILGFQRSHIFSVRVRPARRVNWTFYCWLVEPVKVPLRNPGGEVEQVSGGSSTREEAASRAEAVNAAEEISTAIEDLYVAVPPPGQMEMVERLVVGQQQTPGSVEDDVGDRSLRFVVLGFHQGAGGRLGHA